MVHVTYTFSSSNAYNYLHFTPAPRLSNWRPQSSNLGPPAAGGVAGRLQTRPRRTPCPAAGLLCRGSYGDGWGGGEEGGGRTTQLFDHLNCMTFDTTSSSQSLHHVPSPGLGLGLVGRAQLLTDIYKQLYTDSGRAPVRRNTYIKK